MADFGRIFERALSTSEACLLPPLSQDLDTNPINHDDFNEFRNMLNDQLHLLLDILYQNGNLLREKTFDNQLVQLRVNLLLITCEQAAPNAFYRSDQNILVTSLWKITDDNLVHFDGAVLRKVLQTYKDGLGKDRWKKHLGLVHGFPKFCEILLNRRPEVVDRDAILFILSVGSNLVAHFDPHYKTIGLKVYRTLLEGGDKDLLKELNIHQVIFSESFPMMNKSDEVEFNENLLECLLNVVSMEDSVVRNFRWCKFDDVFIALLSLLGSHSESELSILLLNKVAKLCGVGVVEPSENQSESTEIRLESGLTTKANYRTMRWVKHLMEMMIRESPKMLSSRSISLKILDAFHRIYIESILSVDPTMLDPQLTDLTRKLIMMLMEIARSFKSDPDVVKFIVRLLKIIESHHQRVEEFASCLQNILSHEIFK